jgi:hypothetical protein
MLRLSIRRRARPEPNFGRFPTEHELRRITISAHAQRRFVQRLRPDIPTADQMAEAMEWLEEIGSGHRSGVEQGELNSYRQWMARHVQPHVMELIRCEGFWATRRPKWALSRTPADGWMQVGRMCLFPVAEHGDALVLTTCENAANVTWEAALYRGNTLVPKPYTVLTSTSKLKPPSWTAIAGRVLRGRPVQVIAARPRSQHPGDEQTPQRMRQEQRDRAACMFRERHR